VEGLAEKTLDAGQLSRWLDGFNVSPSTKKSKLSHVNKFARYLSSFGIRADMPELPRVASGFAPYVFTADEMAQIFEIADDYMLAEPASRIIAEFPMLLRILYGCGLRLGEAISLTWDEVDLSAGVLTVKVAKNQKQRIAPMGGELARI
jgi:site-specific recombinase XerD